MMGGLKDWNVGIRFIFFKEAIKVIFPGRCHHLAEKMHRRDRGDHREKHFILKNFCAFCALCGEL